MAGKPQILTQEGLDKLEKELDFLKTVKRRDVADKIKVALSFGDLSENSEYDEAKNEQGIMEARIVEIESILKNVRLVDQEELTTEVINVGNKIRIKDMEFNEVMDAYIVGSNEANPDEGKISDESPIGLALVGHKVGDVVEVEAPVGILHFEILEITK